MITVHPFPLTVTAYGCDCEWRVHEIHLVGQVDDYEFNTDADILASPGTIPWVQVTVECTDNYNDHQHHRDWLITDGQQFYRCRNAQIPFDSRRRMPLLEANKQLIIDGITEFMKTL